MKTASTNHYHPFVTVLANYLSRLASWKANCETRSQEKATIVANQHNKTTNAGRIFFGCIAFILAVSCFDTYVTYIYRGTIQDLEQNPICLSLIEMDPNGLSFFLMGKGLGNLGVLFVLFCLRFFKYRHAMAITYSIAFFQALLLMFLCFSDYKTGVLHFSGLLSHDPAEFQSGVTLTLIHGAVITMISIVSTIVFFLIRSKPDLGQPDLSTSR